ncbi:DDB1- and CUL4-associated factor 5 isoform X2 [Cylas formicarius]|uniref:DDB1- and CUL4-associated factor 5 isoform X2 n=1 Tax=Cylas formicarius TaxID=197179 RepID=UPI00295872C0|nr:DDB1- and CUL4-associated factor 5 isoform X2 [Cylas formicarius]
MARPSVLNPLKYVVDRQYDDTLLIKNRIFSERLSRARNFYRKDLFAHYGCVNAIEFSAEGELLVSGGDDRRVLLWSVLESIYDKGSPVVMRKPHVSNIFCVAFDSRNERIFSGGNDDQVIIHEVYSGNAITSIPHRKPVYGLSINPQNDEIISTAGEDGRLLLFDVREAPNQEAQVLAKQKTGFHSVMFNPTNPRFLVSANSEEGIVLWDCRKPKEELVHYDVSSGKASGISACFNSTGKMVLALRRRLPPVLYETQCEKAVCQFYHPQYYNSCTMKTCSFAGDNDEYVLSGSDDFNLYMWKVPQDNEWGTSHMVLRGHRSIVNQVRYNKHNNLIASSGVEKMIKLWSTIPIGTWRGSLLREHCDPARIVYSHQDYVELVGGGGERISHDYSDQSTLEDAKMMAFFDSLIQREIEGWVSSSEDLFSTDSDSDDQEQDWSKLVSKMFRNGRNSTNEEPKKHKYNKIAQLISKKRNRLAKMAHNKSPSSVQRTLLKEKMKKRKMKQKAQQKLNGCSRKNLRKNVFGETRKNKSTLENNRTYTYRTRQSLRDSDRSNSNTLLDGPSTSTGITSSNAVFRVTDQDSEEEISLPNGNHESNNTAEEDNLINILPTPLNGTQDKYISALEMSNGNSNRSTRNEISSRASTSGTTQETLQIVDRKYLDGCASTSGGGPVNGTNRSVVLSATDSETDFEYDYHTPTKKRRTISASDSGCATGPCSSSSAYSIRNLRNHQECSTTLNNTPSSDEELKYEKFRKRVKKAKVNFRNHIGADSDSN